MNKKLVAILKTLEVVAVGSIPGGALVDAAVHGLVDHTKDANEAILDLAEGAIKAVESVGEVEIADDLKFRAGVAMLEAGFKMVHDALKHDVPPVAAPPPIA